MNKRFKNGLYYRYLIVSYDHAENAAGGAPVTVPPNVLLKGAGDGRIVHAPPLLRWTPVPKATFYNVQVFHRGQKILSAWPAKARRKLGQRWAYGERHSRFVLGSTRVCLARVRATGQEPLRAATRGRHLQGP